MEKYELVHARTRLEDAVPIPAPFTVILDPCGICNFKCVFCPCNNSDFQKEERHKILDWPLFYKIVDDLKKFEGGVKVINFAGYGEPFLNPHYAEMAKVLKEANVCREIRIITNGSLLDEKMSRALIDARVDLVRVSVEALSSKGYKELCGVEIEFSKIVENVKRFYELSRGTNSRITAKVFAATLETEKDRQRFFDIFAPITDYHYIDEIESYWVDFDEMVMPASEHVDGIQRCYSPHEEKDICSYLFTDMCIHSNGIVGACCADWKFATQYGDVKVEHLTDIWNGEKHLELQRAHLERRVSSYNAFCAACLRRFPDKITDPARMLKRIDEFCLSKADRIGRNL